MSGVGVVAPNGFGLEEFWFGTCNGHSGIKTIDYFPTDTLKVKIGGFVADLDERPYEHSLNPAFYDRCSILTKMAADEALVSAGLESGAIKTSRSGVVLGVAMGGMHSLDQCYRDLFGDTRTRNLDPFLAAMPNMPASLLAIEYGIEGLNYTVNTACSSSGTAITVACDLIRAGILDICIAGGAEAPLSPVIIKGFEALRVMNVRSNHEPERACRPFSGDRQGMVLAEGAGVLVLESEAHLSARQAAPLGEIAGCGVSSDAAHVVASDPAGQARAILAAHTNAGMAPRDVEYIQAHGTATRHNDFSETEAIKQVYGDRAYEIPISSVKGSIGHTVGASAAISTIVALQAIREGFLPPTANLSVPDDRCDLDYLPNQGRKQRAHVASVHSFGFGGSNAVIMLRV